MIPTGDCIKADSELPGSSVNILENSPVAPLTLESATADPLGTFPSTRSMSEERSSPQHLLLNADVVVLDALAHNNNMKSLSGADSDYSGAAATAGTIVITPMTDYEPTFLDQDVFLCFDQSDDATFGLTKDSGTTTKSCMLLNDMVFLHKVLHQFEVQTLPDFTATYGTVKNDDFERTVSHNAVSESAFHSGMMSLPLQQRADQLAHRLVSWITKGKPYILAGAKDVPRPFLRPSPLGDHHKVMSISHALSGIRPGRFIVRKKVVPDGRTRHPGDLVDNDFSVLSNGDATRVVSKMIFNELSGSREDSTEAVVDTNAYPYLDFVGKIPEIRQPEKVKSTELKDVILLPGDASNVDAIDPPLQVANKAVFQLASQIVTAATDTSEKRIEAAFSILGGLELTNVVGMEDDATAAATTSFSVSPTTDPTQDFAINLTASKDNSIDTISQIKTLERRGQAARFLVCEPNRVEVTHTDRSGLTSQPNEGTGEERWSQLSLEATLEFLTLFVFEVYLEKVNHLTLAGTNDDSEYSQDSNEVLPSTIPIEEPADYDVLFGRGGELTASKINCSLS
jgi:hypothetical protein